MKQLLTILISVTFLTAEAQKSKKEDIESIKSMCGCFEVTFNFAETFAPDEDYEFHENYRAKGLEYVFAVEDEKNKIALQHLLIVNDTMIVKHWRQDWIYENEDLFVYNGNNEWKYKNLVSSKVKDQWTQKVYQVDDGPRYEGSASWVHVDGRNFWENYTYAPLPRREFSKRDDYNIMKRKNKHEITADGWIHEQDNDKVIKEGEQVTLLAQEKGMNTYEKVEDAQCNPAKDWWKEKEIYWTDVREVWEELFAQKKDLKFKKSVDEKPLFMHLFRIQDEMLEGDYNSELAKEKISEKINLFLEGDLMLVSNN